MNKTLLLLLLFFFAINVESKKKQLSPPPKKDPLALLQAEGYTLVDGIACRVNGVSIFHSDITEPRIDKNGRSLTLDEAIEEELLVQRAAELKVQPTDVDIERQMVKLKERNDIMNLSELEFEEWIKSTSAGLTLRAVKRQFYRIGAVMKARESCIIDASVVTEEEKKRYFAVTPFRRYKLSTCFVTADDVDEQGKLKKDVSLTWNTINRYLKESKLSPQILPVVRSLSKGEISDPILTEYGYELVRLDEVAQQTYEEAKVSIERKLLKRKQQQAQREQIEMLKSQAVIVLYPLAEVRK